METSCWTPTSTETYQKKEAVEYRERNANNWKNPCAHQRIWFFFSSSQLWWFLHVMCWYRSRMGTAERDDFTQGGPTYSNYPVGFHDSALLQAQANWKLARMWPDHFFWMSPIRSQGAVSLVSSRHWDCFYTGHPPDVQNPKAKSKHKVYWRIKEDVGVGGCGLRGLVGVLHVRFSAQYENFHPTITHSMV